jgi:protein-L-isoaspartate O-methyltransferase
MAIRRVALVFDDRNRPDTTGVYCRRALAGLVDCVHVRPDALGPRPPGGTDLVLRVDDDLDYDLPAAWRPRAYWAIDTHRDLPARLARAAGCDLVVAAQRDGAAALRAAGPAARWLPLACDPEIHRRHDVPKRYDLAFVGHLHPGPRAELVDVLRRRFPDTLVATLFFEAMARAYSSARLVFNRSLAGDVNMRVFEAAACGSLLLTDDLAGNGLEELLRDGVHLATYRDADELLDKASAYLADEGRRERVAAAGRAEVLTRHTYRDRMRLLLEWAESDPALTRVAARPAAGPAAAGAGRSEPGTPRPELQALVAPSARSILHLGCGDGRLGAALKARQGAEVVGIERDPGAARAAAERLDRVLVADVEGFEPDLAPGSFDAVLCGGLLGHLREPLRLLRRARGWLRPGGRLVASLANVRHHGVVRALL